MVDRCAKPNRVEKKRSRRKAGDRLPPLDLKPLDPSMRLLKPRRYNQACDWSPTIETELETDLPVTSAEIDAIIQLLGNALESILG